MVSETARRNPVYSRPREVGISAESTIGRVGYTPEELRAAEALLAKERVRAARATTIYNAIINKLSFEEWLETVEMLGVGWPMMDAGPAPVSARARARAAARARVAVPPVPLAVPLGCGTVAGWVAHRVAHITPCGACQAARAMVPRRRQFHPNCPRSHEEVMDGLFVRAVANNNRELSRDLTDHERLWVALLIIQEGGRANTIQRRLNVSKEVSELMVTAICAGPVEAVQEVAA